MEILLGHQQLFLMEMVLETQELILVFVIIIMNMRYLMVKLQLSEQSYD